MCRAGKDFRTTLNEITIDLPAIAMRIRTYKPNAWNMSLRVAGKEMPAELRKGGKEKLAKYAKKYVYIPERRKELVEAEKQELEYKVRIVTDPIIKARKKVLKALPNSVSTLTLLDRASLTERCLTVQVCPRVGDSFGINCSLFRRQAAYCN